MVGDLFSTATPLVLAGLGALLSDLAGAIAVFLEGLMNAGAFVAWSVTDAVGRGLAAGSGGVGTAGTLAFAAATGCVAATLVGGILAWLLARFVAASGANPFIAGLAVNLAASGGADALSVALYGSKGVLSSPYAPAATNVAGFSPFAALALAIAAGTAAWLQGTRGGLRLRAAGADERALNERGVDAAVYREAAWGAAGALASLAGAALVFRVGAYVPSGAAGRGWIALVVVYLGFKKAWGVVAAALAFALADRLASAAQGAWGAPPTLFLAAPYVLALVLFAAYSGLRQRTRKTGGGRHPRRQ